MTLTDRRVRRLRLSATSDADARHASTLLSDALRTASLPHADAARLIVIRKLPLGRISTGVSPGSLALHIERVASQVMSDAVTWDRAGAGLANAVSFAERGDPIVALACLHARGAPADEWFWPAVVPGWGEKTSRGERWVLLFDAASRLPEGALVAARVAHAVVVARVAESVLASVTSADCARWLRRYGWTTASPSPAQPVPAPLAFERLRIPARWIPDWPSDDARLIWLGTLLALTENRARAVDPQLPARVAVALAQRVEQTRAADPATRQSVRDTPATVGSQRGSTRDEPPADERSLASRNVAGPGEPVHPAAARDDASPIARLRERAGWAAEPACDPDGAFTPFAGWLFLVPLLHRLGFVEYLSAHPVLIDTGFPARLLWQIGTRTGLTRDDPQALAIGPPEDDPDEGGAWDIGELPRAVREVLEWPVPRAPLDSRSAAWLTAVRRWSRRTARLGLAALVRRPGLVHVSPTHVDVTFDLSRADVRVRRLALDVSPGWVAWLGRVVQFHYADDRHRPY